MYPRDVIVTATDETKQTDEKMKLVSNPYEILGVDPNITAKELSKIVKSGKLNNEQKKAVKDIMKSWRNKR